MKLTYSLIALLLPASVNAALVVGYEFNVDSNLEGWTGNNTTPTVAGGFLSGTAEGNNDPQLVINGINLNPASGESWTTLAFRVREFQNEAPEGLITEFNPTGLIVQINGNSQGLVSPSSGTIAANGWFEVEYDISSVGSNAITQIRLDPIGGAASNSNSQTEGNMFDVDYIRLNDTVPEPSSMLLGGLGLLGLLRRRR